MTNIELDVARSTIRMNKAVADHLQDIDWEQRRYEIAKEVLPFCTKEADNFCKYRHSYNDKPVKKIAAETAVQLADALIEELKKPQTQK